MSSINTISSAISRLCGSAAIYGGRSTGRAARKRASTSWVRSVDAFASHVVRAWLRLVAPFSSYAVRSIGAGRENLCAHRRRLPSCPAEPRLSTSIERSNVSTRAPRFIRFGHGAPASPIAQYVHRGALRTAEKISRRSEDQIIPIIDPPINMPPPRWRRHICPTTITETPSRCAGDARRSPLGSRVCSTCTHAGDERQRSVVS